MKKIFTFMVLPGFLLCSVGYVAAGLLNDNPEIQDALDFTPSNHVLIDYIAGDGGPNNPTLAAAGDTPQQYVAATKHQAGYRVLVSTEESGLFSSEYEGWKGMTLTEAVASGLPDYTGTNYLGYNIEGLTDAGWSAL